MPRVSTKRTTKRKAARSTGGTSATRVKKATTRTTPRRSAAAAAVSTATRAGRPTAITSPYTKAQLITALAENSGVAKRDVVAVFEELDSLIERHIKKRGAGQFSVPGLLKIKTVRKPATKARKGRNPFTGEEIMIAAKPARTTVRITALKGLKEMLE